MDDVDKTFLRLKYPDSHTWRDTSTIRNGYWPDGSFVRLSDPEMKPAMDEHRYKLEHDEEYRNKFMTSSFQKQYSYTHRLRETTKKIVKYNIPESK